MRHDAPADTPASRGKTATASSSQIGELPAQLLLGPRFQLTGAFPAHAEFSPERSQGHLVLVVAEEAVLDDVPLPLVEPAEGVLESVAPRLPAA